MVTQAEFEAAYDAAPNLKGGSQKEQLQLYGWAKIAKGVDIKEAPKPGMVDFAGKAKRTAWQEMVDAGVTKEQAKKNYVEKYEALKAEHGTK